jgi:hypothetical protein
MSQVVQRHPADGRQRLGVIFDLVSAEYVVLPRYPRLSFYYPLRGRPDVYACLATSLDSTGPDLEKVDDLSSENFLVLKNPEYTPRIYATNEATVVAGGFDALWARAGTEPADDAPRVYFFLGMDSPDRVRRLVPDAPGIRTTWEEEWSLLTAHLIGPDHAPLLGAASVVAGAKPWAPISSHWTHDKDFGAVAERGPGAFLPSDASLTALPITYEVTADDAGEHRLLAMVWTQQGAGQMYFNIDGERTVIVDLESHYPHFELVDLGRTEWGAGRHRIHVSGLEQTPRAVLWVAAVPERKWKEAGETASSLLRGVPLSFRFDAN